MTPPEPTDLPPCVRRRAFLGTCAGTLVGLALGEGAFAAVSPICTHLGCTVDIQGERLVCPCHGSTYDRVGKVLQGPAQQPLARYRTALSADGVLTVDLRARA